MNYQDLVRYKTGVWSLWVNVTGATSFHLLAKPYTGYLKQSPHGVSRMTQQVHNICTWYIWNYKIMTHEKHNRGNEPCFICHENAWRNHATEWNHALLFKLLPAKLGGTTSHPNPSTHTRWEDHNMRMDPKDHTPAKRGSLHELGRCPVMDFFIKIHENPIPIAY